MEGAAIVSKYPIPLARRFGLFLPSGAVPLHVCLTQDTGLTMWVDADHSRVVEIHSFVVLREGEALAEGTAGAFVDTFILSPRHRFSVFETTRPPHHRVAEAEHVPAAHPI